MRKLQSTDFFTFTKIIKKMGIREELKELAKKATSVSIPKDSTEEEIAKIKETSTNEMQIEVLMIFIENIASAEHECYKFVSAISEKSIEELKDLTVFMNALKAIFADDSIKSFFNLALK